MRASIVELTVLTMLGEDPRRAILEEGVICLVCGRTFRHLTNTHLAHHGLTSGAYKENFGYNSRRPLMAVSVRRLHAGNAIHRGLADMIGRRPIVADPMLRARGRVGARALEEELTRRENRRSYHSLPRRDARGRFVCADAVAGGVVWTALRSAAATPVAVAVARPSGLCRACCEHPSCARDAAATPGHFSDRRARRSDSIVDPVAHSGELLNDELTGFREYGAA